jgi:hypothetical protein
MYLDREYLDKEDNIASWLVCGINTWGTEEKGRGGEGFRRAVLDLQ